MFGLGKKYNFERAIQWYQLIEPRIIASRSERNAGAIDLNEIKERNITICEYSYKMMSNTDLRELIEDANALLSFSFQKNYNLPIDPVAYAIIKTSRKVAKRMLN